MALLSIATMVGCSYIHTVMVCSCLQINTAKYSLHTDFYLGVPSSCMMMIARQEGAGLGCERAGVVMSWPRPTGLSGAKH